MKNNTMAAWLPLATVVISMAWASAASGTETVRVATFNVQELNFGSSGFTALRDVLRRADADVVMVQEVKGAAEATLVATLAAAAGYSDFRVATTSGTLSGDLRNAVLSRHPITTATSWSAATASGDPFANDISRDILQVELQAPEVCHEVAVFTVHLKAGFSGTNRFRRAVELMRLDQVVTRFVAAHPDATVFIAGDMNDDIGDGPFGDTFTALPAGLPASYRLGSDISFPVVYDPFAALGAMGGLALIPMDATHEDSATNHGTRGPSGRWLDYIYTRFTVTKLGDEIYDSADDNGTDDAPLGNDLYKAGNPLTANTSSLASDHFEVFADFLLESCSGVRYGFGFPGNHLLTPRAGITGEVSIGSAGFGLRALHATPNSNGVLILGQLRESPPFGLSLDPHVPGARLHVSLNGLIGLFFLTTDAAGRALLPLPLPPNPAFVGRTLNSQWFIADSNGPNGVGSMTDAIEVSIQP